MYKYYYQGKLIRTSKTRSNYTHALFVEYVDRYGDTVIKCMACSSKAGLLLRQFNETRKTYCGLLSKFNNEPVKVYVDAIQLL